MAWTKLSTITPTTSWQFTSPTNAIYFRLKHFDSPFEPHLWICQADVSDGIQLADIKELPKEYLTQLIRLDAIPVFTNRVIGMKSDSESSRWQVQIDVSDYVPTSSTSGSTSSTPSTTTSSKILTFSSPGDTNGVFYWLGTKQGTTSWTNPLTSGAIAITPSSLASGKVDDLVDRQPNGTWYTNNAAGSWVVFDLGSERSLAINHLLLRHDGETGWYIRNFKLQGSNNVAANTIDGITAATWEDLASFTNNTSINSPNAWGSFPITGITKSYRHFRVLSTGQESYGSYYLILAEVELYGTLTTTK